MGFEPMREEPIGLADQCLNHSAISSLSLKLLTERVNEICQLMCKIWNISRFFVHMNGSYWLYLYRVAHKKRSVKYHFNSYSSQKPIATKLIQLLRYITERKFADFPGNRQKTFIVRNYYVKNSDFEK